MSGVVPIIPVGKPAFTGSYGYEVMLCGIPEDVLEGQPVRLAVAGKLGLQPLLQQVAGLFQRQLELLDDGRPEDVVQRVTSLPSL